MNTLQRPSRARRSARSQSGGTHRSLVVSSRFDVPAGRVVDNHDTGSYVGQGREIGLDRREIDSCTNQVLDSGKHVRETVEAVAPEGRECGVERIRYLLDSEGRQWG